MVLGILYSMERWNNTGTKSNGSFRDRKEEAHGGRTDGILGMGEKSGEHLQDRLQSESLSCGTGSFEN